MRQQQKDLEEDNKRLIQMYADVHLETYYFKDTYPLQKRSDNRREDYNFNPPHKFRV
ncbi:hypothetical protein [Cellulophaga sp. L1A9]|uniref:hypothetical protein n=1 Tax=Cellulophaga sp. L1A9 TaxID=2686362 RepID=UPI00131D0D96|nr:hypothetical protein [Cellulophaga sp. L1A9]